jgi:hypothetical protein
MEMQQAYNSFNRVRIALEKLLRHADTHCNWIPETGHGLLYNTSLNYRHLGTRGIISPGRVQEMEGIRTVVASFHHPAGLVAATVKQKCILIC